MVTIQSKYDLLRLGRRAVLWIVAGFAAAGFLAVVLPLFFVSREARQLLRLYDVQVTSLRCYGAFSGPDGHCWFRFAPAKTDDLLQKLQSEHAGPAAAAAPAQKMGDNGCTSLPSTTQIVPVQRGGLHGLPLLGTVYLDTRHGKGCLYFKYPLGG